MVAQGRLGFAVSGVQSLDSRWSHQEFASGHLLWDATGKIMYWLPNAIWDFWIAAAGVSGVYGSPVDSPSGSAATGWSQPFSNGRLVSNGSGEVTAIGGFAVEGVFATNWSALGGAQGVLGVALGLPETVGWGWSRQPFEQGSLIYDSNIKTMFWMPNKYWDSWNDSGGLLGTMGAGRFSSRMFL